MRSFPTITFFVLVSCLIPLGTAAAGGDDALLGVYLGELTDETRVELDFAGKGVYVSGIVEGAGAQQAGIKAGDIIVRFNDQEIDSSKTLVAAIEETRPGAKVEVVVFADGGIRTLAVRMGSKKSEEKEEKIVKPPVKRFMSVDNVRPYVGINMSNLTSQLAAYFSVEDGVLITEVIDDSPAEEFGLRAGDVIIFWGKTEVEDTDDLTRAIGKEKPGKEVDLTIVRKGKKRNFGVVLGKREVENVTRDWYFFNEDHNEAYEQYGKAYEEFGKSFKAVPEMPGLPGARIFEFSSGAEMKEMKAMLEDYRKELHSLRVELKKLAKEMKAMKGES